MKIRARRIAVTFLAIILALAGSASPVKAGVIEFQEDTLQHEYFVETGEIFIPLEDVTVRIGVSIIFNGDEILLGNTANGNIRIAHGSHQISLSGKSIDFEFPFINRDETWYVPQKFLEPALSLKVRHEPDTEKISIYPVVFAITPYEGTIRIQSSLPPEFDSFDLEAPSRSVIDISGAYLQGQNLSVNGNVLGIAGINALRASQFTIDPPTVRVVLEWEDDRVPDHTMYPDSRTISVLVASGNIGTNANFGINLLNPEAVVSQVNNQPDPAVDAEPAPEPPTEPVTEPVDVEPATNRGENIFNFNPSLLNAGSVAAVSEEVLENEVPEPIVNPVPDDPVIPEPVDIPSPQPADPVPVEDSDPANEIVPEMTVYPEEAVDWPLDQLGWRVEFQEGDNGEIESVEIVTPGFRNSNEFTLAGEGGMRLVLDLQGPFIPGAERSIDGRGDILRIRAGQFQPEVTRIVLDLTRVVAYDVDFDREHGRITVRFPSGDLGGKTIVIDPGHGGEDPGAVVGNYMEKVFNLEMSLFLASLLTEHGARVVLTRESDYYVTLADRINMAERENADLLVVIHNNATEGATAMQGSLFLYNNPENMPLYRLAHRGVAARTGVPGLGPIEDERGLYILRHAGDMPVLFVEGAFMTNSLDFARLTDPSHAYESNIMMGVMDGILAWYMHRDLPPVEYPDFTGKLDIGIFDLAGRTVAMSEIASESGGSAWDMPEEFTNGEEEEVEEDEEAVAVEEEPEEEVADDEVSEDEVYEVHRLRGRGAYRFD